MKLRTIIIEKNKGINAKVEISINDFNCIVGKNNVGKSTIFKGINAFINDNASTADDKNFYNS